MFDTDKDRWVKTYQRACPFGALSSVYHWDRIAASITSILRWAGLPTFRYVDYLFMAVPASFADEALKALVDSVSALGWALEPSKTEGPVADLTILGLHITVEETTVHVTPDEKKVPLWLASVQKALDEDSLHHSVAEKLAGQLNFAGPPSSVGSDATICWPSTVGSSPSRRA